jgi:hypothetical protein
MGEIMHRKAPARTLQDEGGCPTPAGGFQRSGLQTLLNRVDLAELLRVSLRTLDRQRAAGEILDPLPGPGQPRWRAAEVGAWLEVGRPRAEAWRRWRRRRS